MANTKLRTRTIPVDGIVSFDDRDAKTMTQISSPVGTSALAGSSITDATALTGGALVLTAADGTKGSKLPTSSGGFWQIVRNPDAANAAKVYPATAAGKINNGAAGAALSVPANTACLLIAIDDADNWFSIPRLPS